MPLFHLKKLDSSKPAIYFSILTTSSLFEENLFHQERFWTLGRDGSLVELYHANKEGCDNNSCLSSFTFVMAMTHVCRHVLSRWKMTFFLLNLWLFFFAFFYVDGLEVSLVFSCKYLTIGKIICHLNPFCNPDNWCNDLSGPLYFCGE